MSDTQQDRRAARQARLITAMASTPARIRSTGTDTPLRAAARIKAHDLKLAAAKTALDDAERAEEVELAKRFGRLAELGAELSQITHRQAALDAERSAMPNLRIGEDAAGWDVLFTILAKQENLTRRTESIKLEQSILYGQPIHPTDLAPNGRFIRNIRWHARTVVNSHQSGREDDILSEAIMLCYLDADALTEVTRFNHRTGLNVTGQWPTIGGMYKKIRAAHRDQLDQFRQIKRGLIGVRSLDELAAAGVEPTVHFEHYGIQHLDPAELDWDGIAEWRVWIDTLGVGVSKAREANWAETRYAMIDAEQRARRVKAEREASEANRYEAVKSASAPTGLTKGQRDDFEVDRILIEGLIDGETLAELAADLGVTVDTLTRRLSGRNLTAGLIKA